MKLHTLPRYLLGSRSAILEIAASRSSLVIGILFVISAGLAREYDGEDLLHEPWHILRPLAASLLSGSALFAIVYLAACVLRRANAEGEPLKPARAYASFLGLFWMTAPLAWLYAIPYERMLPPVEAVEVNLWTLALVALWRVLLMTRVVSVIYGIGIVPAFFFVMLFSDIVTFTAMSLIPRPIIDVMGGIRHSARDELIMNTTIMVQIYAVLLLPVWIIGSLIALCRITPRFPTLPEPASRPRSRSLLILAIASIVAFTPLLIIAQPEQIRRHTAERLLLSGRVADGLSYMSRFEIEAFPPQWEPPPKLGYGEARPRLGLVAEAMTADLPTSWPAPWVADAYVAKISRFLHQQLYVGPGRNDSISYTLNSRMDVGMFSPLSPDLASAATFLIRFDPTLSESDRGALERHIVMSDPTRISDVTPDEAAVLISVGIGRDAKSIENLLRAGFDPDHVRPGPRARSPLVYAIRMNDLPAAELLIDAGADVNAPSDEYRSPPAHIAVFDERSQILTLLLERGADPTLASDRYPSALHAAIGSDNPKAIRILLARDDVRRSVNIADDNGWTSLHRAYQRDNPEIIKALLEAGADPTARDSNGRAPSELKR